MTIRSMPPRDLRRGGRRALAAIDPPAGAAHTASLSAQHLLSVGSNDPRIRNSTSSTVVDRASRVYGLLRCVCGLFAVSPETPEKSGSVA
jgi:hypothetical protein